MRVDAFWILGAIGIWFLSVVTPALTRLVTDECKAWMPWFLKWLIRLAIGRLPEDQRERYREEWQSDIDETPGEIVKIIKAVGFVQAAQRRSSEAANKRPQVVNAECHIGAGAEVARVVEFGGTVTLRMKNSGDLTVGGST